MTTCFASSLRSGPLAFCSFWPTSTLAWELSSMLYDKRVGQEIEVRAKALLGNASHILYGDASEEDIEEARQAVERAKHEVAQRQEKDLLDMLYEWRAARTYSPQEGTKSTSELLAEVFNNG